MGGVHVHQHQAPVVFGDDENAAQLAQGPAQRLAPQQRHRFVNQPFEFFRYGLGAGITDSAGASLYV